MHYLELDFEQQPFVPGRDGDTVSFEVLRGIEYSREYECNFVVDPATVPQTDTAPVTLLVTSSVGWPTLLAVFVGRYSYWRCSSGLDRLAFWDDQGLHRSGKS